MTLAKYAKAAKGYERRAMRGVLPTTVLARTGETRKIFSRRRSGAVKS
jgi:hypothetical protein